MESSLVLAAQHSEDELWQSWLDFAQSTLGGTSSLIAFAPNVAAMSNASLRKGYIFRHNHPEEFADRWFDLGTPEEDNCARQLIKGVPFFLWEDARNWPDLSAAQVERLRADEAMGMGVGVTMRFGFFDGRGMTRIGVAARWQKADQFRQRWTQNQHKVLANAAAFETAMRPRMISNRYRLTPRQTEVLRLLAGGLSTKETAHRLGIATKTVFNVMDQARKVLDAANTIEAVTKALAFRLI